ncbi:MAG: 4-(cytidine 5'-diphospho)-2-C-methyl-D-erythritol kinase [Bacteroidales bacterium]|nr:4-(cytidine 5'-diphospho)-2-C-methyl-D-erythritol kinase [Bacteroidales bacterium]
MVTFPRAKINIGLNIIRKREDGFHDIETIFYPTGLCDALEFVIPVEGLEADTLTGTGFAAGCPVDDNLVVRAVRLLREDYEIPFLRIHLHKMIPPGSGLGGGSSDAAHMLMLLNRYFDLGIANEVLMEKSLTLGSDCPFFIYGSPAIATGRGELFDKLGCFLEGNYLVIVHEGIHISTPIAYRNSKPHVRDTHLADLIGTPSHSWKNTIENDFEEYAFSIHPRLAEIKESLYESGAWYSAMSGSGSAVYGLYSKKPERPSLIKGTIIYEGWLQ